VFDLLSGLYGFSATLVPVGTRFGNAQGLDVGDNALIVIGGRRDGARKDVTVVNRISQGKSECFFFMDSFLLFFLLASFSVVGFSDLDGPSPRFYTSCIFTTFYSPERGELSGGDVESGSVVLFGGRDDTNFFGDLWLLHFRKMTFI